MVYLFVWRVVGTIVKVLFRVEFRGREGVPDGPLIVVGNHSSYLDPVVIAMAFPSNRPVHFMAKSELFSVPGLHGRALAWLTRHVHAFPVRRGAADREAIGVALDLLKNGGILGVFPEGTRHRDGMGQAQGGAAFIALRAGVPIVPAGVSGTDRIRVPGQRGMRFPKIRVVLGEPIDPNAILPDAGRRERLDALTGVIMERIATSVSLAAKE